ncbi:hypothetical protein VV02_13315 [Luteipulveratus mongoliensis]|uniref:Uncharacterized protein n=2 Tax=Luteipulveratus mongoliensis TaxID=571913 RepID=A0A0K1JIS0_9MICO|nr:hypothetical protein VV02_13315 [Luteipulveratus mongoliensis]
MSNDESLPELDPNDGSESPPGSTEGSETESTEVEAESTEGSEAEPTEVEGESTEVEGESTEGSESESTEPAEGEELHAESPTVGDLEGGSDDLPSEVLAFNDFDTSWIDEGVA